jgi:iron complex outermembrane receptor protein
MIKNCLPRISLILLLPFFCVHTYAQDESDAHDDEIFLLPGIEVTAERETVTGAQITQEEMRRDGARDLWEAVRYTPGVMLSGGGARNESNFTIRGFGPDRVPVFVDGVLMANPYRRVGDAARVLTGDLESVVIQKGYSSMLYGANALGGAVIMRTAKPRQEFELFFQPTVEADGRFDYSSNGWVASAGTRRELYYGKLTYQRRDVNHFRLPNSFEPTPDNPQQKGRRMWSDSVDTKVTAIAGITPLPALDIWATYTRQDSDKGLSPPETVIRGYRIWDWPIWKRNSYSLNGAYSFNDFFIEALAYYDKYDNRMVAYASMLHYELGVHRPPSDYDEYSVGGRFLAGWNINGRDRLQASVVYKKEDHRGLREIMGEREELIHVNEDTWSFGMEYTVKPRPDFRFETGFGFDALRPNKYWSLDSEFAQLIEAGYFVVKTDNMFLYKWQLGAFYDIADGHEFRLTYARRNHFPNMSQRYSTRFGDVLPNPNLGPEIANHFEFGYTGRVTNNLFLSPAVYYSIMDGKIVDIQIPNPADPRVAVDYARNLDRMSFYGFELGANLDLNRYFSAGLAFSLNEYRLNRTQDRDVLVMNYYPRLTTSGYLLINPVRKLEIMPRLEYVGSRHANTAGTNLLSSYWLANIRATYDLCNNVSLTMRVNNIFDRLYEIREHFPMAGRSFSLSLNFNY